MTPEQREALRQIDYAHDEMNPAIKSLFDFTRGGDIGWNQSMEMEGYVSDLRDKWKRIESSLTKVRLLIDPDEQDPAMLREWAAALLKLADANESATKGQP